MIRIVYSEPRGVPFRITDRHTLAKTALIPTLTKALANTRRGKRAVTTEGIDIVLKIYIFAKFNVVLIYKIN